MRVAIMQPYLFPYLGYFQLIAAADLFVLLDDAAYSRGGWTNRNVLAGRTGPQPFSFPVVRPHLGQRIDEVRLACPARTFAGFLKTLQTLYGRAPFFQAVMTIIRRSLSDPEGASLARLNARTLEDICRYIGISTPLISSARRHAGLTSRGAERVLAICAAEGATSYLNAEGGFGLYRASDFSARGIELRFLRHRPSPYPRGRGRFIERLSILDVMMFNDREEIRAMLAAREIVEGKV